MSNHSGCDWYTRTAPPVIGVVSDKSVWYTCTSSGGNAANQEALRSAKGVRKMAKEIAKEICTITDGCCVCCCKKIHPENGLLVETTGKGDGVVHIITITPAQAKILVDILGKSAFLEDNAVGTKMPSWAQLNRNEGSLANRLVNELSSDWSE